MCEHVKERLLELQLLTKRKMTVLKSLEWAISNGDKGMSDMCERELKIILKRIGTIKKELARLKRN